MNPRLTAASHRRGNTDRGPDRQSPFPHETPGHDRVSVGVFRAVPVFVGGFSEFALLGPRDGDERFDGEPEGDDDQSRADDDYRPGALGGFGGVPAFQDVEDHRPAGYDEHEGEGDAGVPRGAADFDEENGDDEKAEARHQLVGRAEYLPEDEPGGLVDCRTFGGHAGGHFPERDGGERRHGKKA